MLLGHFFVSLGQDISWFELIKQSFYIQDLLFAALIAAAAWLVVRAATVFLDKRYDWMQQPTKRIGLQLALGYALPVILSFLLVTLFYYLVYGIPVSDTNYPVYEFPVSLVIIGIFNLFYLLLYFYQKAKLSAQLKPEPVSSIPIPEQSLASTPERKTLVVSSGIRNIPIPIEDIALSYIDNETVFIHTFSNEQFPVNRTLDELSKTLNPQNFFRANRQVILHRRACRSYINEPYGKLKVEVYPLVEREIIISQQKAPEFKKWLEEIA